MRYFYLMAWRLILFVLLILFVATPAMAQIATYQVSLKDSTQEILYAGCPNKVMITNLPSKAKVKFEHKDVVPTGNNYILTPERPGNSRLSVYSSSNKLIFQKNLASEKLQPFVIQLGIVKYKVASVKDIMANPSLVCNYTDCLLKPFVRIVHYDITLISDGDVTTKTVSGDDVTGMPFSKEIQNKIAGMKNGDRIFIENIGAVAMDGVLRHWNNITIEIAFDPSTLALPGNSRIKLRDEVRVVVDGMATKKSVKRGDGWLEKLEEAATDSELVQLTDHENVVVRNYAFLALTSRKNFDLFPIIMKHFHDTASVETQGADVVISWPTNEYFILAVLPTAKASDRYQLTYIQKSVIDSVLLSDPSLMPGARNLILKGNK